MRLHSRRLAGALSAVVALSLASGSVRAGSDAEPVPVTWVSAGIPVASYQRYMAQAIDQAASQLNLEGLEGKTVSVEVSGILQESEPDLWQYARHSVETRVALRGGQVAPEGPDGKIVVRLPEAGVDRVLVEKTEEVSRKRQRGAGWLAAGLIAGVVGSYMGTEQHCVPAYDMFLGAGVRCKSGWQKSRAPALLVGFGVTSTVVGVYKLTRPASPQVKTRQVETFQARVAMEVTVMPRGEKAWSTHGRAEVTIPDAVINPWNPHD